MIFLEAKAERFFSRTLVGALNSLPERTWAAMTRGKDMTELTLGHLLRPYGVRPKTVWVGKTSARGYLKQDFEEVFSRYVSKSQVAAILEEAAEARRVMKAADGGSCADGQGIAKEDERLG